MRILYIPLYTSSDLESCSTFMFTKQFFLQWAEQENVYIYFPVYEGFEIDHPRIKNIPLEYGGYKSQRERMREVPENLIPLFREKYGTYFVDVVICDSAMMVPYAQNVLKTYTDRGTGGILFVNLVQFVYDKKINGFGIAQGFHLTSLGLASSDMNVVSIKNDLRRLLIDARESLSPTMVKHITEKAVVSLGGVDVDLIESVPVNKSKQFIFNWGTALNSGYNVDKVFAELDLFFKSGRDFKVIASSGNAKSSLVDWSKYSYFEISDNVPQKEFWERCATCHCFIYMPAGPSELSYSVLEQQLLGLIGILSDTPSNRNMVYPGYPFLVNNHAELMGTIRKIYSEYEGEEIQNIIQKQREYIRSKFNVSNRNETVFDLIGNLYRSMGIEFTGNPEYRALYESFEKDEYTLEEWVQETVNESETGLNPLKYRGRFGSSKNRYRRVMLSAGFIDTCETEQPVFRRVK